MLRIILVYILYIVLYIFHFLLILAMYLREVVSYSCQEAGIAFLYVLYKKTFGFVRKGYGCAGVCNRTVHAWMCTIE